MLEPYVSRMNWRSFSRLAVVAGNGRVVGSGRGVSRRRQSQSDVRLLSLSVLLSLIAETVSGDRSISPTYGNVVDIMSNSMQASLLRKNLSELSVIYVTCRVSNLFPSLSQTGIFPRASCSGCGPPLCPVVCPGLRARG